MTEKIDRRYRRTQQLLIDALIALAQDAGYDSITIRDITDKADISYSTFFRHYQDKDQLLMSITQNAVQEMRELMQEHFSPETDGRLIFQHVQENQSLYRLLLGGFNSSAMVQKVQQMIVEEILLSIDQFHTDIPADVVANHVAASSLAMVKWWLDNDMPYSPAKMGSYYATLIIGLIKPA